MTDTHDTFKELYEARHEPENLRPIAEVFWRVLLVCAMFAVAGIIGFGVWEFSAVMSTISSTNTSASTQQTPAVDRDQLEKTLIQISERRANFEMGRTTPPVVGDPSKSN